MDSDMQRREFLGTAAAAAVGGSMTPRFSIEAGVEDWRRQFPALAQRVNGQPLAYLDHEFLESDEARPLRILAEYLEPLRRFKAQNIQDTVVFFGSARIHSREHAEQALDRLQKRFGARAGTEMEAHLTRGR